MYDVGYVVVGFLAFCVIFQHLVFAVFMVAVLAMALLKRRFLVGVREF